MKKIEILKLVEQMFRDKRPAEEIHTAVVRHREATEGEEEAATEERKSILRIVEKNEYANADRIASLAGVEIGRANWILGRLESDEFILITPDVPHRHRIIQKGRDWLYDASA